MPWDENNNNNNVSQHYHSTAPFFSVSCSLPQMTTPTNIVFFNKKSQLDEEINSYLVSWVKEVKNSPLKRVLFTRRFFSPHSCKLSLGGRSTLVPLLFKDNAGRDSVVVGEFSGAIHKEWMERKTHLAPDRSTDSFTTTIQNHILSSIAVFVQG